MAGITRDQRMLAWNVEFIGGLRTIAGIYQRDGFLTVADVARELDMCLQFSQPQGAWHAILLPMGTTRMTVGHLPASETIEPEPTPAPTNDNEPFILLDQTDTRSFPTPATGTCAQYRYAFHSASCSNPRHSGSAGLLLAQPTTTFSHPFPYHEPCIIDPGTPSRRRDPRYLPINKRSTDARLRLVPIRRGAKRKATSSDSSRTPSRAPSPSIATSDMDLSNVDIPIEIIGPEQATPITSKFRTNVLTRGSTCAISGKGNSWLGTSIGGPAIEVAHIIPQCHWNTYPIKLDQGIADVDRKAELEEAWLCTWSSSNGLPLLSHLHKCFEARLIAIHPITHRIRTFAWYDVIDEYHGRKATIPRGIDANTLQHHWDMCCIENMSVPGIPTAPISSVSNPPNTQSSLATSNATPQEPAQPPPSSPGDGSGSAEPARQLPPSGSKHNQQSLVDTIVHPLSPPSSDTMEMRWRVDNEIIDDPRVVDRLRQKGWVVHEVPGAARPKLWWMVGDEVIEDPQYAERLRKNGWNVREMCEEQSPTRPRPRKRPRSARWQVGAHLIDDEYEAQRLRDQGWIVETVDEAGGCEEHVSEEHVSAEHVSAEHVSAEHVSAEHVSAEHLREEGAGHSDRPLKRRSTCFEEKVHDSNVPVDWGRSLKRRCISGTDAEDAYRNVE